MKQINQMMEQARAYYRGGDLPGLRTMRDLVGTEYSKKELEAMSKGFDDVMDIYELEQEALLELDTLISKLEIKLQLARR